MISISRALGTPSRAFILACTATLTVACGSSHTPVSEPAEPTVDERLQEVLNQAVSDGLPGAALSIRGDTFSFDGVAGVEDIATAVPLTVDHRFYQASVGKTYTAVALVKLAADMLLDLDDPITRWLPDFVTDLIPSSEKITIRSLLNHTSGIFDFQADGEEWIQTFIQDPARAWTNADILPFFVDKPLHFMPGTDFRYSNSNYVLAALIAEAASGLPIQEIIRNTILAPLGLQHTVHGDEAAGLANLAHGYFEYQGELVDAYPWYSHYGVADGSMQSSAADVATFVRGVLAGNTVLNDTMRAELLKASAVGNPPSTAGLGLDIIRGATPDIIYYANAGDDPGARTEFFHITGTGQSLTIVLCASASDGNYDHLFEMLDSAVLEVLVDAGMMPGAL